MKSTKKKTILATLTIILIFIGVNTFTSSRSTIENANETPQPHTETLSEAPAQRGITLGSWNEPPNIALGRHSSSLGHSMNTLTHNGLFRLEYQNLAPTPDLIEGWTALSDTLFEFHIKPDIMFHNGYELSKHNQDQLQHQPPQSKR